MKVTLQEPYETARGVLAKDGEYYIRMLNGHAVVQRRPIRNKPPTDKQLRIRKQFAERYAGRHDHPSDTQIHYE